MRFFSNDRVKAGIQAYNLAVAASSLHHYLTNPDAHLSENGSDILIHLMNYWALNDGSDNIAQNIGIFGLNCMRLGSVYSAVTENATQFSFLANCFEAFDHAFNALSTLYLSADSSKTKPSAHANDSCKVS